MGSLRPPAIAMVTTDPLPIRPAINPDQAGSRSNAAERLRGPTIAETNATMS